MIKFIEIDGPIIEDERVFAYFDTECNEFFGWTNCYTWSCFNEFELDYNANLNTTNTMVFPLRRFRVITPEWEECS